jgi:hypothetical protein
MAASVAVPEKVVSRAAALLAGAALCLTAAGCVTLGGPMLHKVALPPQGPAGEVAVAWEPQVYFVPDFANGGVSRPGLVGRMYLFGPADGHPVEADGRLRVNLYADDSCGGPPKEYWEFPPHVLKTFLRKDTVGWGYTLYLPWYTYSPETTNVRLAVVYTPACGPPLYAPVAPLTVRHPERPQAPRPALETPKAAPR